MVKNFLFLDMDGVLNSNELIRKWCDEAEKNLKDKDKLTEREILKAVRALFNTEFRCYRELIFPELVELLNRVLEEKNVQIIWSTTWRLLHEYRDLDQAREMLTKRGINGSRLIGVTPDFSYFRMPHNELRMKEIRNVISNKRFGIKNSSRIAILDDLDMNDLSDGENIKMFQTTIEKGLTEEIVQDMLDFYK